MKVDLTVAVIVPLFNEYRILPQMIKQLQQLGADELIVVDGGSDDGTLELLQQSGLRWISSEAGRARQMNAGAEQCESDILFFMHADTIISSTHVLAVKEVMVSPEYVGGRFDVRLSGTHPAFALIGWMINLRSRLSRISTGDQCQFVRRKSFEKIGGFADLPLMEDVALSRVLKREGKIACLRQKVITSSRRWERSGILRTVLLMWKLRLLFWLGWPADQLALIYRQAR
ncbi:TIGR04283 family arsenosugar biosynthesis glycosyltransferase [Mariprofundus sp. KV]|uniref:TIGR04283 family arsenosugar biosynthesis glycosyltransferase n=1 Tax=Mariprofundus sp. KV TaxID=2608715 RepID=UPI0018885EF5|nr:TIGR04283 family arsenosugar biosynthesis glycosyltransferase [Mariprofundus sp. KV]